MHTRLLTFTLLICAPAFAQQRDFSNVEIKTHKAAGNVFMLEGSGGNIGVSAGPDGILIIDDQFAPLAPKIRKALDALNTDGGKLKFVLNTHYHGDHTGGNPEFGREATIVAHKNVRARVTTAQTLMGRTTEPLPPEGWPVITFDESLSVHFNGEEIRVIHYPNGHTDGDSVIHFTKSNVVHMGDDFFSGSFPFVDLGSGGSVQGLTANVARVIEKLPAGVKIIPGHGPLSTVKELKAFHEMLVETTRHVKEAIDAGKSLEQIKADGLPSKWDEWGTGFISTERWIEIVHASLTR